MTFLEDLLSDLTELVGQMRRHDVRQLSLRTGADTLALTVAPTSATNPDQVPSVAQPAKAEDTPVPSPEMGVFRSNGLGENYPVRAGEIVGFVEAGPLRLPVTASAGGTLGPALVRDGCIVGYHNVLFLIRPDG